MKSAVDWADTERLRRAAKPPRILEWAVIPMTLIGILGGGEGGEERELALVNLMGS